MHILFIRKSNLMKKIKFIIFIAFLLSIINVSTTIGSSYKIANVNPFTQLVNTHLKVVNPPLIEGYLYRDVSNAKIYWLVSGVLHHILDYSTYTLLFTGNPENYTFNVADFQTLIQKPIPSIGTIVGTTIDTYAVLGQNSGTVYLRLFGGTGIHYKIPNPATMDAYHLKWQSIVTWPYNPISDPNLRDFPVIF